MLVALSAARRHSRSAVPPAGKGTTIVTGWPGKAVCACPTNGQPAVRRPARTAPTTVLLRMVSHSFNAAFCCYFARYLYRCATKKAGSPAGAATFRLREAKPVERFGGLARHRYYGRAQSRHIESDGMSAHLLRG